MYSFNNDYSETAHPRILEALCKVGMEQNNGYGLDVHCERAMQYIKKQIRNEAVEIHFLPGGTITNLTMISHVLRPYQAVIAADTAHINIHETGAIEATGHKVLAIPTTDGKLTCALIQPILDKHEDEHWVMPAMVYVSNPTEIGTVYSKQELEVLHQYCQERHLLFYLDGARLSMALAVESTHLTLADLPHLTDAFYIGGTKVGALFGEALVIVNQALMQDMRFNMKQHGAIMAKGWLLGMQFEELFRDDLYLQLGRHSNHLADLLRQAFMEAGFSCASDSPTNQLFPILPNELVSLLDQHYITSVWNRPDERHTCIRLCTSWAMKQEDVLHFIDDFKKMLVDANY
ncbi:MAG: aminotransferase class I/II-fold pyridoxal phosphate-dependent enzyme [Lachnospiraceae bacterium]